ncbi:MAG: aldehyde dehydrogenase family protein, partial [Acetivibrio ethanolgignens]
MEYLEQLGCQARQAARILNQLGQTEKNRGLLGAADALEGEAESILKANEKDVVRAQENGMKPSLVDRLKLTKERIAGMADGLRQVAGLPDPVGEVTSMKLRPNGLQIGEKRVPLGVVGIIYESRPNVTSDAFALCFKAGNAVILRGGSDAIYSNQEITKVLQKELKEAGLQETSVQLIEDTSRETVRDFMSLTAY